MRKLMDLEQQGDFLRYRSRLERLINLVRSPELTGLNISGCSQGDILPGGANGEIVNQITPRFQRQIYGIAREFRRRQ